MAALDLCYIKPLQCVLVARLFLFALIFFQPFHFLPFSTKADHTAAEESALENLNVARREASSLQDIVEQQRTVISEMESEKMGEQNYRFDVVKNMQGEIKMVYIVQPTTPAVRSSLGCCF